MGNLNRRQIDAMEKWCPYMHNLFIVQEYITIIRGIEAAILQQIFNRLIDTAKFLSCLECKWGKYDIKWK